jgi:hypothetical protein
MKKASLLASAAMVALGAVLVPTAAHAQVASPFADVPTDHWAYSSVEKLRNAGIVIGYPDGTYGGKRPTTRYEFAIAIARLLDRIPPAVDLTPYARKEDLANFATKDEVNELRRLIEEFKTELTTLGVEVNNLKKRVDALEGRVTAIEEELKRVKITGNINLMVRGNNRFDTDIDLGNGIERGASAVLDQNGYRVTKLPGRGSLLADTRVLHDLDLNIKARLSETATATAILNFGNYLPFLGSIASYTGARSDRARGVGAGRVNQNQDQTIYRLSIDTPVNLLGAVKLNLSAGRIPLQLTPYTLKLIDVDAYFYNDKTDLGDIPVDGGRVNFNVGPVGVTGFAAKTDPIKFVSNINGQFPGEPTSGLYAGAAFPATRNGIGNGGGFRGNSVPVISDDNTPSVTGNRPTGSSISPQRNGAMSVEQLAGVRATFGTGSFGTIGGTYMVLAGQSSGAPAFGPDGSFQGITDDRANFNRVFVYGADANLNFGGLGINASYTKTDTGGERLVNRNGVTVIETETETKIDEDNEAYDVALSYSFGNLSLGGGYRYIAPFFGAPGFWGRIGSWTNPVDIQGFYVNAGYALGGGLRFNAAGQFYEGTGDANGFGGLTEDDTITNVRAGLQYGLTSSSNIDLGIEYTQYEVIDAIGAGAGGRGKPEEIFYNIGYGFSFNPNTSFKFLYQIIDYKDKGTGFDTFNGKGGVAAAQFNVKF